MKKLICIFLCIVITVSGCCFYAFASEKEREPIILIPGFLEARMSINMLKDDEEQLFPPLIKTMAGQIVSDLPNFTTSLFKLFFAGDTENFGRTFGFGANAVCEKLKCNPDGTSKYPVEHYPNDPEISNYTYLSKLDRGAYMTFPQFAKYLSERMNPDDIFIFSYDSRMDSLSISDELRAYVKAVKEYTGAKKVSLFSLSYGGQIIASYFYQYLSDNDINKAVMSVPALAGTSAVEKIFTGTGDIPLYDFIIFAENFLGSENEISRLLEGSSADAITEIFNGACPDMADVCLYWGGPWSLSSPDIYDGLKEKFLDPVASAAIIEKQDIIHYDMMPKLGELFESCKESGVEVSVISGSGRPLGLGGEDDGDILLPTSRVTGATCAKLGERFGDGYVCKGTSCNDKNHNHVSPSMAVDASTAFLPENTWFIDGEFHSGYFTEPHTLELIFKLLLTDDIKDVHSDPEFPQFEYSDNPNNSVHVSFNKSVTGYLGSTDSALEVKNVSKSTFVKVLSVTASGLPLKFDALTSPVIAPGQTISIPFSGNMPNASAVRTDITVNFVEPGVINSFSSKTFGFTVMNGLPAPQKEAVSPLYEKTKLQSILPDFLYGLLTKLSLRETFECIFSTLFVLFNK